jgi:hypothetical protein
LCVDRHGPRATLLTPTRKALTSSSAMVGTFLSADRVISPCLSQYRENKDWSDSRSCASGKKTLSPPPVSVEVEVESSRNGCLRIGPCSCRWLHPPTGRCGEKVATATVLVRLGAGCWKALVHAMQDNKIVTRQRLVTATRRRIPFVIIAPDDAIGWQTDALCQTAVFLERYSGRIGFYLALVMNRAWRR